MQYTLTDLHFLLGFSDRVKATVLFMTAEQISLPHQEWDASMRALMRLHDWSRSSLGHPDTWTVALRVIVDLMLDSKLPMSMVWGAERILLYNEAYIQFLGSKHPLALGRPLSEGWPEIWKDIGPLVERACAGEAFYIEDVPLLIERNGRQEQAWFSFFYSPVRDDQGAINGMCSSAVETTGRVLAEKRQSFLLCLTDALRGLSDPEILMRQAAELTGRHLNVSQMLYGEIDLEEDTIVLRSGYTGCSVPPVAAKFSLHELGAACVKAIAANKNLTIHDIHADARTHHAAVRRFYTAAGACAILLIPLMKPGGRGLVLAAIDKRPHVWSDGEVALVEEVARRTWSAVEQAHAEEALRRLNQTLEERVALRTAELERAQQEAVRVTNRLQFALESAQIGEWNLDFNSGKFYSSPRLSQCLGYARSVTGCTLEKFLEHVHSEDRMWVEQDIQAAMHDFKGWHSEYRVIWPDRSVHWIASHGSIYFEGGKPTHMLGIVADITARKDAEKRLRETAGRLQFTLEAAQIGDWDLDLVHDTSRRSLRHDQCFGYTEPIREWGFEKFIQHVHPEDRNYVTQQFNIALAELKDWNFECRVIWPDRSVHWIAALGTIYHVDTQPTKMSGIVFDITERKQAEQELRNEARRKDEFLAMLAHELRNPLAPIGAAADLLALGRLDEARVRQTSEIISRQVGHMTSLVDDLLDVSRVTRGLVSLEKVALDIKNIATDALEQVRPLVEARGHHLEVHLAPEAAFVSGDRKRLVQVLANLLNNAAKYTAEGGRILLHMEVRDAHVELCVQDNGIGMAPDLVERVFGLFTQAQRSADRSQGGLGIGLALVKSLVELHDGTVTAHSAGIVGQGSKFVVRLPRLKQLPQRQATIDGQASNQAAVPALRLLIVDDNVDAAKMLALLLEAAGHEVFIEHQSRTGLERARLLRPHVCLLDIGLPDIDGIQLARQLRAIPEMSDLVLIAVTGYGQPQDRENALAAGFNHHFVKPVSLARIHALLTDIARSKHR